MERRNRTRCRSCSSPRLGERQARGLQGSSPPWREPARPALVPRRHCMQAGASSSTPTFSRTSASRVGRSCARAAGLSRTPMPRSVCTRPAGRSRASTADCPSMPTAGGYGARRDAHAEHMRAAAGVQERSPQQLTSADQTWRGARHSGGQPVLIVNSDKLDDHITQYAKLLASSHVFGDDVQNFESMVIETRDDGSPPEGWVCEALPAWTLCVTVPSGHFKGVAAAATGSCKKIKRMRTLALAVSVAAASQCPDRFPSDKVDTILGHDQFRALVDCARDAMAPLHSGGVQRGSAASKKVKEGIYVYQRDSKDEEEKEEDEDEDEEEEEEEGDKDEENEEEVLSPDAGQDIEYDPAPPRRGMRDVVTKNTKYSHLALSTCRAGKKRLERELESLQTHYTEERSANLMAKEAHEKATAQMRDELRGETQACRTTQEESGRELLRVRSCLAHERSAHAEIKVTFDQAVSKMHAELHAEVRRFEHLDCELRARCHTEVACAEARLTESNACAAAFERHIACLHGRVKKLESTSGHGREEVQETRAELRTSEEQKAELVRDSKVFAERQARVKRESVIVETLLQEESHQLTECRAELEQDRELRAALETRNAHLIHESELSTERNMQTARAHAVVESRLHAECIQLSASICELSYERELGVALKAKNAELIRQSECFTERVCLAEHEQDRVESRLQDECHQLAECQAELAQDRELRAELATLYERELGVAFQAQNADLICQSELSMERCVLAENERDSVESHLQEECYQLIECRAELARDRELRAVLESRHAEATQQSEHSTEWNMQAASARAVEESGLHEERSQLDAPMNEPSSADTSGDVVGDELTSELLEQLQVFRVSAAQQSDCVASPHVSARERQPLPCEAKRQPMKHSAGECPNTSEVVDVDKQAVGADRATEALNMLGPYPRATCRKCGREDQNIIMDPRVGRGCNLPPKRILDCSNPNCCPYDFDEEPEAPRNADDGECNRLLKLQRMARTGTEHERKRATSMMEASKRKLEARAQDPEVSEPARKRGRQTLERLAAAAADGSAGDASRLSCHKLAEEHRRCQQWHEDTAPLASPPAATLVASKATAFPNLAPTATAGVPDASIPAPASAVAPALKAPVPAPPAPTRLPASENGPGKEASAKVGSAGLILEASGRWKATLTSAPPAEPGSSVVLQPVPKSMLQPVPKSMLRKVSAQAPAPAVAQGPEGAGHKPDTAAPASATASAAPPRDPKGCPLPQTLRSKPLDEPLDNLERGPAPAPAPEDPAPAPEAAAAEPPPPWRVGRPARSAKFLVPPTPAQPLSVTCRRCGLANQQVVTVDFMTTGAEKKTGRILACTGKQCGSYNLDEPDHPRDHEDTEYQQLCSLRATAREGHATEFEQTRAKAHLEKQKRKLEALVASQMAPEADRKRARNILERFLKDDAQPQRNATATALGTHQAQAAPHNAAFGSASASAPAAAAPGKATGVTHQFAAAAQQDAAGAAQQFAGTQHLGQRREQQHQKWQSMAHTWQYLAHAGVDVLEEENRWRHEKNQWDKGCMYGSMEYWQRRIRFWHDRLVVLCQDCSTRQQQKVDAAAAQDAGSVAVDLRL